MKNLFYITLSLSALLLSASATLHAQSAAEATKALDKTYEIFKQSNGIKLLFKITTTEAKGQSYPTQSGVALIKGDKFKLETDQMEVWFDGKTQWTLLKETEEVNISAPTSREIASISPLALLGMYKSSFKAETPVSKTIGGRSAYIINLTPLTQQGDYKRVSVTIDKQSYAVMEINLTMKDNSKNRIEVSHYNTNNNFADATFVFSKTAYPNVTIVDLR